MYQNNRKGRRETNEKESGGMHFHDTVCFPRRMESKQKSRVLPRFYDVPSTEYARLFFLISFRLPLYPSFIILRTPRAILSTNAISATGRKGKKGGRERGALEWTPRENSMFFRWRSIITRARTGSISGYFKLLTRRDIPERAETSSWLSSGKFRTTDRKLIRRARIKTKAECWRQWTRRSETVESTRCTRRIEPLFSSGVLWNRTLGDTAVKCCFK